MYIKRLEIVGFKSFPDRVVVPLNHGISAVVGPNGCGKSNIIDAIRWVMGEQSPSILRGRNMDDVLFNGSQNRPPSALAEVTLTLARDYASEGGVAAAETAVTRRLYRSGDSEYLLNRAPCRLKDVIHFFMDVGVGARAYGIIAQNQVGRLVDARPEERRALIDEAAGITRYKLQKKTAERKIEAAEQNLTHVSAVMAETKKQLSAITRAAAKAARYRTLKAELRELDLSLSARKLAEKRSRRRELSSLLNENKSLLSVILAGGDRLELEMEALKLEHLQAEKDLEEKTGRWHRLEGDFRALSREAELTVEALAAAAERRRQGLGELDRLKTEKIRKMEEEARLTEELEALGRQAAETSARHAELREAWQAGKAAHEQLTRRSAAAAARLDQTRRELARLAETLAGSESLSAHHQSRLESLAAEAGQAAGTAREAGAKLEDLRALRAGLALEDEEAAAELAARREAVAAARGRLEEAGRALAGAESDLAAKRARLETLAGVKANFGWYPQGLQALMAEPDLRRAGLIGPLAEALDIPDGYEAAAEAFMGERLAWLLAEDRPAALKALAWLKEKKLGRSGFVALSEVPGGAGGLTRALLGDFTLADDLSEAAGAEPDRIVLTRDGDYGGRSFLAGGRPGDQTGQGDAGLLARLKELETLEAEAEAAEAAREDGVRRRDQTREFLAEAQEALVVAENARRLLEARSRETEWTLAAAAEEEKGAARRAADLVLEKDKTAAGLEALRQTMTEALAARETVRAALARHEEEVTETAALTREAADELEELRDQGQEAAIAAGSAAERWSRAGSDLERAGQWLSEAEENQAARETEAQNLLAEMDRLAARREELAARMKLCPERLAEAEAAVAAARAVREERRAGSAAREQEAREIRKRGESLFSIIKDEESEMLGLDFALGKMAEDLWRDWRVVMPDPEAEAPPAAGDGSAEEPVAEIGAAAEEASSEAAAPAAEGAATAEGEGRAGTGEEAPNGEAALREPPAAVESAARWAGLDLPPDAEERRERLKAKIENLGEVSLGAIEEERELTRRHTFYQTQYDDLARAVADLKNGIGKINHTCKVRFAETFKAVDAQFREIFPILFEGGEGWLNLTDESDPLESGVEIHVHPPGKKITVMSLLSGGEKALTALALIFAMYLIKPSPFCLLDETDAPLDEANIDRFNRLLRNLSKASQIIMVTHNKRTMQISGTLYGVTMEAPGVSRLVSVNLQEAEALTDV